jgi:hypothetical protein
MVTHRRGHAVVEDQTYDPKELKHNEEFISGLKFAILSVCKDRYVY